MSANLTKRDIVIDIYERVREEQPDITQAFIRDTVQMTLQVIADALASGKNVELRNFGVFEIQVRKSRIGRNPKKPETDVVIPRRAVVKFKVGKDLKTKIKKLELNDL